MSVERRRDICDQSGQINWILAVAGLAGNRTLLAIDLTTPAQLSPHRSLRRSM